MIEKSYQFKNSNEKTIEKIIDDNNLLLNHMILVKGTGLPEHLSNSNVYMMIINGTLSIQLDGQEQKEYVEGNILNIPYGIKMNINNFHDENLEFFVVKTPNPKDYKGA